jgi:hypothetical protein
MYTCFAPILSGFNNNHSRVIEWQTDQMATTSIISPTQVDKFSSIRCVASSEEKCFYFSFRIHATGSQFIQVLRSKDSMQTIRQGEGISFNSSVSIPHTHGKVTHVGDILLKDATATHRGKYLKYLCSEVLPVDMPAFDLKICHKDPPGCKIQILTVRCGKQVSTEVARILSNSLNGEGTNPEIFISHEATMTEFVKFIMTSWQTLFISPTCPANKSTFPLSNILTPVSKLLARHDNGRRVL